MNIIFDFDGTIADTSDHFLEMANEILPEMGFPKITERQYETLRNSETKEALKELDIPLRALPKLLKASHAHFAKKKDSISLIPGMEELIIELAENHELGILTSNDATLVVDVTKRLGIYQYFTFINSSVNLLGKHRSIKKIMKKLDYKKSNTIYIGDEIRDINGSRKAGIDCIAVTWGLNTESILKSHKPRSLASTPKELLSEIKNIDNR